MVREARQPSIVTPQRLRVSLSSVTTASRDPPSSIMTGSQPMVSHQKKRVILGERLDNVDAPTMRPNSRKTKSHTIKRVSASLAPPSLPSSREKTSTRDALHLVPMTCRSEAAPSLRRDSLVPVIDEGDTMLLDMSPPEMSLGILDIDESGDELLAATRPGGVLMTPANSQEVSVSSLLLYWCSSLIKPHSQNLQHDGIYLPLPRTRFQYLDFLPHPHHSPCQTPNRACCLLHPLNVDLVLHPPHPEVNQETSLTSYPCSRSPHSILGGKRLPVSSKR